MRIVISGYQLFRARLAKESIFKIPILQIYKIYKSEAHSGFSVNDSEPFSLFAFIIRRPEF